jgi:thiamine-phosphate pyrophosphorylase
LPKALDLPPLYAIVDVDIASRRGWDAVDLTHAFLSGGARLLQVRAKTLDGGPFLDLARSIVQIAHEASALVVINDRADLAVLAGADGVHVGQEDLRPADVRRLVGDGMLVGLSTHSLEQVTRALTQPISYLAVGPIFGTTTKDTGYSAVGVELIEGAVGLSGPAGVPVVAIGGITRDRVREVWQAGAASAAVITDLIGDDPAARVADFNRLASSER